AGARARSGSRRRDTRGARQAWRAHGRRGRGHGRVIKLVGVLVEGQLYLAGILAVFAMELAVLFWGLWSRRPIVGLVAVFATVPLLRSTLSAIRACFLRIRPPEGLRLDRSAGARLYDFVEEIRRAV